MRSVSKIKYHEKKKTAKPDMLTIKIVELKNISIIDIEISIALPANSRPPRVLKPDFVVEAYTINAITITNISINMIITIFYPSVINL